MKIFKSFLAILLVIGLVAVSGSAADVKFNLKLGGSILGPNIGYDYGWEGWYAGEGMALSSSLKSGASMFGGTIGVGLVYNDIELYTNFTFCPSRNLAGEIFFQLPSYSYWDKTAENSGPFNMAYKESIIELGVAYHFPLQGVKPYVGAGLSMVSGQIDLPETLIFTDRHQGTWYQYYSYWSGYYWVFSLQRHEVDLDGVEVKKEPLSATGFHFKVGLSIPLAPNVEFFFEGKYVSAKSTIPIEIGANASGKHFLGDRSYDDTRKFPALDQEDFPVDLGGLSGTVGVKIGF